MELQDLMLEAMAEVQELVREFVNELTEPEQKVQLRQAWISLPDELKEKFKSERPQEYADMMKTIGG